ncbi:MAG TPA: hypothetical protein VKB84_25605 [Candidatus Binataceae bacterium]|nr:hypothetical protein [Candidatus Binataceae bacterium]
MNLTAYSSLTAFLAHRRAMRGLAAPDPAQARRLAEMEASIAELSEPEREALESADDAGEPGRHRGRAERHLTQILRQRGILAG